MFMNFGIKGVLTYTNINFVQTWLLHYELKFGAFSLNVMEQHLTFKLTYFFVLGNYFGLYIYESPH